VPGSAQPVRAAAAVPAKPSALSAVVSGPRRDPKLWWFYGDEGIGKSTLVADAPQPVFFDIEGRTRHLHVRRYNFRPTEGDEGTVPRTLAEVETGIDDIIANVKDWRAAGFRSVVFDGLAALEALIFAKIVEEARARGHRNKEGKEIENIEDFGFQSGQKVAAQMWRQLVTRFEALRFKAGMHVVLLGHAAVGKYKNPTADDYDTYRPRIDPIAAGVLLEKCDVVGFVTYEDSVRKAGRKAIGVSGDRVIHLTRTTTWAAKNSLPMPHTIDLQSEAPWAPFADALEALYSMTPDGLRSQLAAELERLGEDFVNADGRPLTATTIRGAIQRAGDDTGKLHLYLVGLQQSIPITDTATEET
jgi:hypothetical protein